MRFTVRNGHEALRCKGNVKASTRVHRSTNGALNKPYMAPSRDISQTHVNLKNVKSQNETKGSRAWSVSICVLTLYLGFVSPALDLHLCISSFLWQANLDVLPPLTDMRFSVASVVSVLTVNSFNIHNLKLNHTWCWRRKQTYRRLKNPKIMWLEKCCKSNKI